MSFCQKHKSFQKKPTFLLSKAFWPKKQSWVPLNTADGWDLRAFSIVISEIFCNYLLIFWQNSLKLVSTIHLASFKCKQMLAFFARKSSWSTDLWHNISIVPFWLPKRRLWKDPNALWNFKKSSKIAKIWQKTKGTRSFHSLLFGAI